MEIVSYPGPVPGLALEDFRADRPCRQVPLRNRRIGEFLKELRLAEMRSTGIPKIFKAMKDNGSPKPVFDFDKEKTFFKVILPAHPRFVLVHTLRESSYLWSIGEKQNSIELLNKAYQTFSGSGAIAGQLIEYLCLVGKKSEAEQVFETYNKCSIKTEFEQPYLRYFRCAINENDHSQARRILNNIDINQHFDEPLDIAIAFKRIKEFEKAHILFTRMQSQFENDFDFIRNYAEVKIGLCNCLVHCKGKPDWQVIKRLQREAHDLLVRSIPLARDHISAGWCHFNLARLRNWLRYSRSQVESEYIQAMDLIPDEPIFKDAYANFKRNTFFSSEKEIELMENTKQQALLKKTINRRDYK